MSVVDLESIAFQIDYPISKSAAWIFIYSDKLCRIYIFPWFAIFGGGGALVRPQCHEMVCVRLAKCLVCQVKACVCENWGKPRRERRRREGEITLEFVVAISQACMFQILTKNLLFILQSTFFQICVLNILKCLHMNL